MGNPGSSKSVLWGWGIACVFGFLCTFVAAYQETNSYWNFAHHGKKTTARIVEARTNYYRNKWFNSRITTYRLRLADAPGEHTLDLGSPLDHYAAGDQIEVIYLPDELEVALAAEQNTFWAILDRQLGIGWFVFILLLGAVGIFGAYSLLRDAIRQSWQKTRGWEKGT